MKCEIVAAGMVGAAILTGAVLVGTGSTTVSTAGTATTRPVTSVSVTSVPPAVPSVHMVVGDLTPARYWYSQPSDDCEPSAANVVVGVLTGHRLRSVTIDHEAERLGIYVPGTGSDWTGLPALLAHYGIRSREGSHSIITVENDLAAGHRVIASVNAEIIWAAAGLSFGNTDFTTADHALVVDEVDVTTQVVTLTDTGTSAVESIPMSAFMRSWRTGGYQVDVTY